jgi:hypothetical protein
MILHKTPISNIQQLTPSKPAVGLSEIFNIELNVLEQSVARMEESASSSMAATSFLDLPMELRITIYELLIQSSIVQAPLGKHSLFVRRHPFDLEITTTKVRHCNLRRPSNLIYTCRQIQAELSALIYPKLPQINLIGDFLLGLEPTNAIFDILERRPWVRENARTVNITLESNHILSFHAGVAVNDIVLNEHPWLSQRLRVDNLKMRTYVMKPLGVTWVPRNRTWWQTMKAEVGARFGGENSDNGHDTFFHLAQLFKSFPLVEKIVIETEHRDLLALFPAPRETAESFRELGERGVEINILLKKWQIRSFHNMLFRNGIQRDTFQLDNGGRVDLSYETWFREGRRPDKDQTFTFRLLDFLWTPKSMVEKDRKAGWMSLKFLSR